MIFGPFFRGFLDVDLQSNPNCELSRPVNGNGYDHSSLAKPSAPEGQVSGFDGGRSRMLLGSAAGDAPDMTVTTRFSALLAPILLLSYGVLRFIDGLDGQRKNGPAWDVGHVCFFVAMVLFAVVAAGVARTVRTAGRGHRYVADVALVATVFGAAAFLWVITGDLFASFPSLPDALQAVGPALFQVGTLVLLVQLVIGRRLPVWSPVLVGVGFGGLAVNLDLIPIGAILILVGLLPIARPQQHLVSTGT